MGQVSLFRIALHGLLVPISVLVTAGIYLRKPWSYTGALLLLPVDQGLKWAPDCYNVGKRYARQGDNLFVGQFFRGYPVISRILSYNGLSFLYIF